MKILVSAYACEPGKGSEPAVGWNWTRELAREHEVWVLTRANNRAVMEAELARRPQPNIHPLFVDLPRWISFWKRGQRGVRAYYYLWQFAALRRARRAHAEVGFDLVHHLTFATAFAPALVGALPVPFLWGPVGGGVRVPWRQAGEWGVRGSLYEALRAWRRAVGRYADPLVRLTWRRARMILVQNPETLAFLPARHRGKAIVCPNAGIDPADIAPRRMRDPGRILAVTAGRLLHFKGVSIALKAIAEAGGQDPEEFRQRYGYLVGLAPEPAG
jgi:glycosyltransferase involved in cell wall biosynthesis